MQNFREVTEQADKAGAAITCSTTQELATAIDRLLSNAEERRRMGEAAKQLVLANTGASRRYAQAIADEVAIFHEQNKN
jgi:3-deoxy-D-manno-octulosonic-acid transferase